MKCERGDIASLPHHCVMSGDSVKLSWVEEGKVRRQHWAENAAYSRSKFLLKKQGLFSQDSDS